MNWWRSFKHKVFLARQLALRDWLVLTEAWWALLIFYLALHWVRFDRLEAFTRPTAGKIVDSPTALALARKLQRLVSLASRLHLLSMTCLVEAFTLRWMLDRRGIPALLCIGANKNPAGINAHAWVEIDGQAIDETQDVQERFKVLEALEHEVR